MKVSKNYSLGPEITDLRELVKLANEKKSVAYHTPLWGNNYNVKPAAFIQNWNIRIASGFKYYHIVKTE